MSLLNHVRRGDYFDCGGGGRPFAGEIPGDLRVGATARQVAGNAIGASWQ